MTFAFYQLTPVRCEQLVVWAWHEVLHLPVEATNTIKTLSMRAGLPKKSHVKTA